MTSHDILWQALGILHLMLAGALVVDLLRQHRSPAATLAWVAILLLLPWVGLLLYVLAGAPRKRSAALVRYFATHAHAVPPADGPAYCTETERLLRALGLPAATRGNRLRLCARNEDAGDALLEVIGGAQRRLVLSVFSFEADESGFAILEALRERAAAGVDVRMLVDGYGSLELPHRAVRALRAAGGHVARHRPLWTAGTLRGAFNYRNHRKLVVADGQAAWIGGRNLARKYLRTLPDGAHWTDLSLRIDGPAAAVFESVFRSDWLTATRVELGPDAPATAVPADGSQSDAGGSCVQVLASGPDMPDDTLHALLLAGITGARERVWIASPFFVPDDALQSALQLACRRGLDVRIIVPQRSNLWLADRVRSVYLAPLAAAGASVLHFQPTVLHAKVVILDDRVAVVGSANFDMRSLFTNHEVAAVLYDANDVAQVAAVVASYAAASRPEQPPAGFAATALSGALRIIAPLL